MKNLYNTLKKAVLVEERCRIESLNYLKYRHPAGLYYDGERLMSKLPIITASQASDLVNRRIREGI